MNHFCFTASAQELNMRVDQLVSRMTGEPREFVKQHKNSLQINDKPSKLSYRLQVGDRVLWEYPDRTLPPSTLEAQDIPLDILFEDEHLIVLNKPAGMVVHPSKGHWEGTLSHALLHHLGQNNFFKDPMRPGIVHRLDKDTCGLMMVAKDAETQQRLGKAFRTHKILKIYTALVQGQLKTRYGKIEEPLGRSRVNRLLFKVDPQNGKEALTEYRVLEQYARASLVKIRIHTGRTHQIRVHFQHLGHPIIGDPLYSRSHRDLPLCLASTKIGFIHPFSKKSYTFIIPLPSFIEDRIKSFQ